MKIFLLLIAMLSLSTPTNAEAKGTRADTVGVNFIDSIDTATEDSLHIKLTVSETMPTFQGGDWKDFAVWLSKNVQYPKEALDTYLEGRVTVSIVIERDGTIGDVDIVDSPSDILSREVLKAVILSPKEWTPGINKGKNVRVSVHIPVRFKLDRRTLAKQKRAIAKRSRQN